MDFDFNSAVNDIFRSQDLKRESAYSAAYAVGQKVGFAEGYPHGVLRGSQIAREIGYYRGFALCHRSILHPQTQDSEASKRKLVSLNKLIDLCERFPRENTNEDLDAKLLEIQSRFKQVCSIMSIDPKEVPGAANSKEMF